MLERIVRNANPLKDGEVIREMISETGGFRHRNGDLHFLSRVLLRGSAYGAATGAIYSLITGHPMSAAVKDGAEAGFIIDSAYESVRLAAYAIPTRARYIADRIAEAHRRARAEQDAWRAEFRERLARHTSRRETLPIQPFYPSSFVRMLDEAEPLTIDADANDDGTQ